MRRQFFFIFFFFNDTATTEIYTLSLHDALPISTGVSGYFQRTNNALAPTSITDDLLDRKSTRLNSSHQIISYAVFCLKKKKSGLLHSRWSRLRNPRPHALRLARPVPRHRA